MEELEDLYENAPCGYLSTRLDGGIVKINTTLLEWLGYTREQVVGVRRFSDLLSVGGRIYHETHYAPLLQMQGEVRGVALELVTADGSRLPVLLTSQAKPAADGRPAQIRTIVFDAEDRRTYEQELLRARAEAEAARQDANRERERVQRLATTLQRSLLPPALPLVPGMEVASYYHPAAPDEIGGDFYDLFPIGKSAWGLFLGDVCGKGAEAAAITSHVRYTARAAAVLDPDPVAVLHVLNTVLNSDFQGEDPRFCTIIVGLLTPHPHGTTLVLASGGHPPALLLRADGRVVAQHTRGGQLVGIIPGASFVSTTLTMRPGDTVLLYTDGLTEARIAGTRTRYDEDGLLDYVSRRSPTSAPVVIRDLETLLTSFGDGLDDDTALLALSIPAFEPVRAG